jgi:hypothetical protein
MRRRVSARSQLHLTPTDRLPACQALFDDAREWRRSARQHLADVAVRVSVRHPEQPAARRIERLDGVIAIDHEQAGREAGDDLVAQPLGRFRPRGEHLLAQSEARDRLLHRRRHEDGLGPAIVARPFGHRPRCRERPQNREDEHRRKRGDDRRQAEEHVRVLGHDTANKDAYQATMASP